MILFVPPAQIIAGSGPFGIFGIRLPRIRPQQFQNRWIVGVDGTSGVRAVSERAGASRDTLGLMSVDVTAAGEACNIQDDDGNWWDIVANETADCAAMFEGGDR